MPQQDNLELTAVLYLLQKTKGFTRGLLRELLDRGFDFLSLRSGGAAQPLPGMLTAQFALYDFVRVQEHLDRIRSSGIRIIGYFDVEYPQKLKELYDPPLVLYAQGRPLELTSPSIAVVGTRKCSSYGSSTAYTLAAGLVAQGITIISGMAEGIDTCAHRAALDNHGYTIAVLGGGFNHIFPASNQGLFEELVHRGTVLTEYEPDIEPRHFYFPQRNRIVTGLSDGALIVEGSLKSGAMISAYLALEQGKDVFAVPGDIGSSTSRGPHKLIKEGAKLVESVEDILGEQPFAAQQSLFSVCPPAAVQQPREDDLSPQHKQVFASLSAEPVSIEVVLGNVDMSSAEVISSLLELEILGYIKQHPGKLFSRS